MALTKENTKQHPEIWKSLDAGEYNIVFATPEILLDKRSHFAKQTMRRNTAFRQRLRFITLDEAHLVWDWVRFRRTYTRIGQIRAWFPLARFIALSATFPAHVMKYCSQVCKMKGDTRLIVLPGRRSNINVAVARLPHRKDSIRPLRKLIPDSLKNVTEIEKTLIFVDSIKSAIQITLRLRARLKKVLQQVIPEEVIMEPSQAIQSYFSIIDVPTKDATLKELHEGTVRIVVCTDAMSLGVNIPDITRVIQWAVTKKLHLSTLIQRVGRCV